ncbi:Metallophosphoesterase domain-containing protein 1 [Varanus komodoensis]|nr:Metallophosphoesterase domain-containing protein 1 [Varanus komodoensis]
MIKDQNGRDLTEAEEIKKRWQDYTEEELYKEELNVPDNHDGVVTDLEPDILECEIAHDQVEKARQPWFYGWGFNLPRGQALLEKWNLIPDGIDILITHGPPLGFLDWVPKKMQRVGCVELLNTVQRRIQPRLHVFGHIHEGYGVMADGTTTYVNASVCTVNYQPLNPPIVIDLPTPRNT